MKDSPTFPFISQTPRTSNLITEQRRLSHRSWQTALGSAHREGTESHLSSFESGLSHCGFYTPSRLFYPLCLSFLICNTGITLHPRTSVRIKGMNERSKSGLTVKCLDSAWQIVTGKMPMYNSIIYITKKGIFFSAPKSCTALKDIMRTSRIFGSRNFDSHRNISWASRV